MPPTTTSPLRMIMWPMTVAMRRPPQRDGYAGDVKLPDEYAG